MGRRRGRGLPHPQNLLSRGARGGGKHSSVSGPDPQVPGLWTTWSRCLAPVLESRGVDLPAELLKGEDAWRPSRPGLPPGDRQSHPGTTGQVLQGAASQHPALHGQDSKGCLAPSVVHTEVEKPCPGEARPAAASLTCWALRRPNGAGAAGAAGLLAEAPGGLVLSIHRAKQRPSGSSWAAVPRRGEASEALP